MKHKDKVVLDEARGVLGGVDSPPTRLGQECTVRSYTDDGKPVQTIFFDNVRFNSPKQARQALIDEFGSNSFIDLKISNKLEPS